ncbi:Transcriptional regulator, TetR family [Planococcus halocryophilus Or1]|uniref:TetR family transcriptional regulator n=1 Tax=Planococcus halocryophilus TaxID=1215089 RepID=A0A1C7DPA7_9BACL|nr:TetR/AcrR family transcriptional regulator [Planococcus halocryophilus]ANU13053.1 TetR family transcriptional regulator [Planococcus halocryophilus]EMF47844.1 Transcriptional regulator, TetR family [Planococcus halocryophilus Or1]
MEDLLKNVELEKRDRILNSAMKEFSKNTFQKASTNKIVEDAGISKGLLFHYFGNKEKLYKYLEFFTFKVMTDEIKNELDWDNQDILVRLKGISMIKLKVFQKYPYLTDFSLLLFKDSTVEEIMHKYPDFPLKLYSQVYTHNIDYSLFKEELDVEKALDIIKWTMEKFSDEFRKDIEIGVTKFDNQLVEKEIFKYIDMLKECFYR